MNKKICFIIILLFNISCFSQESIGIMSSRSGKQMKTLIKSFKKIVKKAGHKVKMIDVAEKADFQIIELMKDCTYVFCTDASFIDVIKATKTPGVYIFVSNPEDFDLIDEDGKALGPLYGISSHIDPSEKFSRIKKILPDMNFAGFVSSNTLPAWHIDNIKKEAEKQSFNVIQSNVNSATEMLPAVEGMKGDINAFLLEMDPAIVNKQNFSGLMKFSMINKIPVFGFNHSMCKAGLLACFEADYEALGKQAGEMMVNVILGILPEKIVYPFSTSYTLNMKTAKILNREISGHLTKKAYEIY